MEMIVSDSHKEKIIIVAENDEVSRRKIIVALKANGFTKIRSVNNGEKINEVLTSYHSHPESLGLIILNECLPHCQLLEFCHRLSSGGDGLEIPFVILGNMLGDGLTGQYREDDSGYLDCLRYKLDMPVNSQELILMVNFKARSMIDKIQALGCKFALDDFGAGFCSFNYLKTFPVDYVKIDGQFIRNLLNNETDQILVKSMVEIATKLGKKTIAEFIETPDTAVKLKEIGVNFGQGYAFGRPERYLLESIKAPLAILLSGQLDQTAESIPTITGMLKNSHSVISPDSQVLVYP